MYNNPYGCGRGDWRGRQFLNNPPVNISENNEEYLVHLYAPSLVKENFILTTKNDVLSIRYKEEKETANQKFTRREFRGENIDRSFDLKGKINIDNIRATYKEGVLVITLPKTEAAKQPSKDVTVE